MFFNKYFKFQGSENTNSNYLQRKVSSGGGHHSRSKHDLIPLADLLNGSFEENSIHLMDETMSAIDMQATKDELVVQETRYVICCADTSKYKCFFFYNL